jgi:hypothetical protein
MTESRPCDDFDVFVSKRDLETSKATIAIKSTVLSAVVITLIFGTKRAECYINGLFMPMRE